MNSTLKMFGSMKQSTSAFILMTIIAFSGFGLSSAAHAEEGSLFGYGTNYAGQIDVPAGDNYVAIEADYQHNIALKNDGSIVTWGYDNYPTPEGNDFIGIDTGNGYSLALKNDGSIVGWGSWSAHGASTPPAGNNFVDISAGYAHALALTENGSIIGWGLNNFGQSTPPEGSDFVAIDTGFYHSVALREDGSIAAWGDNQYGQATAPAGNDFIAVSAGKEFCLALKEDGSIVGWGRNHYGQATAPAGNDFVAIDAGDFNGIALKKDGSIAAWGSSFYSLNTPPTIPAEGKIYVAISAGPSHYLALVADQPSFPTVDDLITEIEDLILPELQAIIDNLPSDEIERFQKAKIKLNKTIIQLENGELSAALKKIIGVMSQLCGAQNDGYDVTELQQDMMRLAVTIVSIGIEEALEMGIDISVAQPDLDRGDELYHLGQDLKAVKSYTKAIVLLESLATPSM